MRIVFVEWLIIPGKENVFKDYWRSALPIGDRTKLIGEFLSRPTGHEAHPWVTWDLRDSRASCFINVGLWADEEAFQDQVGRYFDPEKGKLDFEFSLRRRALLTPDCWRMGDWSLPRHDSGGVL